MPYLNKVVNLFECLSDNLPESNICVILCLVTVGRLFLYIGNVLYLNFIPSMLRSQKISIRSIANSKIT